MTNHSRDHGVADLMHLYAVRELILCYRPTLSTVLAIDPHRPRITVEGSDVVLDKTFGTWAITAPGIDGVRFPQGADDAALLMLQLFDDASAVTLGAAA